MSEHRCFPIKRLSTHTMHFRWHHRNLSKNDHESLETNHQWLKLNEDTHLLLMWKEKALNRCIKLTRRWNMISPVIFAGALTIFAGALPPWAPLWWRGRCVRKKWEHRSYKQEDELRRPFVDLDSLPSPPRRPVVILTYHPRSPLSNQVISRG